MVRLPKYRYRAHWILKLKVMTERERESVCVRADEMEREMQKREKCKRVEDALRRWLKQRPSLTGTTPLMNNNEKKIQTITYTLAQ